MSNITDVDVAVSVNVPELFMHMVDNNCTVLGSTENLLNVLFLAGMKSLVALLYEGRRNTVSDHHLLFNTDTFEPLYDEVAYMIEIEAVTNGHKGILSRDFVLELLDDYYVAQSKIIEESNPEDVDEGWLDVIQKTIDYVYTKPITWTYEA